ncbi:MAG: DMT family transporter [Methanobacteriota archaeon]|nr:MAG: DMT family transporter [Euryarchaeota archaeon]
MRLSGQTRGYFFISVPILGFGIAPILIDIALETIDVYTFLFSRFFLSALLLTPILSFGYLEKVKSLLRNKYTYYLAICQAVAIVFQYVSQLFVIPSFSTIITKSYLIYVPFIAPVILKERFLSRNVMVAAVGFLGVLLISGGTTLEFHVQTLLGIGAAIVSSLGFAFYIVYSSRMAKDEEVDNLALLLIILWFVALVSAGLMGINYRNLNPIFTPEVLTIVATLIVFSTLLSYLAYFMALEEISATTGSVLLLLQNIPPFLSDVIIFDRKLGGDFIFGSILIITASIASVYYNQIRENT